MGRPKTRQPLPGKDRGKTLTQATASPAEVGLKEGRQERSQDGRKGPLGREEGDSGVLGSSGVRMFGRPMNSLHAPPK